MYTNSFYISEQVSSRIRRIISKTGEFMYLVEGEETAVLIDTSIGYGNLKKYVESLTSKEIIVILTHGHVDHAMGATLFKTSYLNPVDLEIYNEHKKLSVRKGYLEHSLSDYSNYNDNDFINIKESKFLPLEDGMVFDLGGLNLEIINVPGHTPGSVAVMIREERALLLGDACNTFTFLFDENSLSVEAYKKSLIRLNELTKGKYDKVYLSHEVGEVSNKLVNSVIEVCNDVLYNESDDIPFEFMGMTAYIAKKIGENMMRKDGGLGNIVFNKNKVFDM